MRSMTVDPHGLLWLDNPLLAVGLLSLIWVVVATLHAEPWARRGNDEGGLDTDQAAIGVDSSPAYQSGRVSPLARRPHQATVRQSDKARRHQAYRVSTARR
jgi:hypothetical protein